MYEYAASGLGWSDIADYPACRQYPGGGVQKCFINSPGDRAVANRFNCIKIETPGAETSCDTTGGSRGERWCCPNIDMRTAQPLTVVCEGERVSKDILTTDEERMLWEVQDRLCRQGLDPGSVDGTRRYPNMLIGAIKAFQVNYNLPETGNLDDVTLYHLGFTASQVRQMSQALAERRRWVPREAQSIAWLPIAGILVAGGFLAYAVHKFIKR
jgi:hypothetical protein